jgi:hypothetical protein
MIRRTRLSILCFLICLSPLCAQQATYTLKPTPKTVAWGYYDAKAAPVLRVKSRDTAEIQTPITWQVRLFEPLRTAGRAIASRCT